MKDKPCKCDSCKHSNKFDAIIAKLPKADQGFMNGFYGDFMSVAEDLEYYRAIMAGTWPSALEQLTVALAEAKRLRADEAGFK